MVLSMYDETASNHRGLTMEEQRVVRLRVAYEPFHGPDDVGSRGLLLGKSARVIGEHDEIIRLVVVVACRSGKRSAP